VDDVSPPPNVQAIDTTSGSTRGARVRGRSRPNDENGPADDIRRRVPDGGEGRQPDAPAEEDVRPSAWARLVARAEGLRPAWKALIAYAIYQTLAYVTWVLPLVSRFARQSLGTGARDSRFYQWDLAWTPFALAHHLNPLHAGWVWAPSGTTLAWSAFIPGPAFVMWPITAAFSPLVSMNVLLALSPALAAWGAYLVCHRLTRAFWPSLAGGCLFGFSSYLAANMVGYLNLVLIFPIPLLVYLVIRNVEGSLGWVAFVLGFAATLVGLFSISTELFATSAVIGGITFAVAVLFGGALRERLWRTGGLILLAGGVAALALAPYLHDIIVHAPDQPVRPAAVIAQADLWSLVIPPVVIRAGGKAFDDRLRELTPFPRPNGQGYLGFAIIAMLAGFAITEWRRRSTWLLIAFVVTVTALTLGPVLHIGGVPHGWMPESLFAHIRLLRSVIPARFAVFAFLGVGVIAALWVSRAAGRSGLVRWVIVAAAVISVFPRAPVHLAPQKNPAFFTSGQFRDVLQQDEVAYPIPYNTGDEDLWQATADFWFKLAQGYIGWVPTDVDSGPLAHGLHGGGRQRPIPPEEFRTWTAAREVTAVIVDDRALGRFRGMLEGAGYAQVFAGGGVSVWRPTG
jgi:hypothetical protein